MAFYTSRVDEDGNEIERHLTSRSIANSLADSSGSCNDFTSRSYDTKSSSVRMSTRRYLNTAVYVESASEGHDMQQNTCEDQNKCSSKSETQSDIVPPLDLQSEENYPTTRDYTYSYRKQCEVAKMDLKPDMAYENWLSGKRKVISREAERRRKIEQAKREELEERKRLSQAQYEKWLENKSRQQKPKSSQSSLNQSGATQQISISQLSRSQLGEEEVKQRLDEWERTKRMQLERRRRQKLEEEQKQRELEESRRQAAAQAWADWSNEAGKKPNPVPLNRGIFTLRGTISDIFVNPNEWQPIIPSAEGDGDN